MVLCVEGEAGFVRKGGLIEPGPTSVNVGEIGDD